MTATARDELIQPDFHVDPHAAYSRMRADGPVQKVALSPDASIWLVTRYDQGRQALNDPRLVKAGTISPPWFYGLPDELLAPMCNHMLSADPLYHTRLRKLVAAAFTHRRIQGLRPRIQEITDSLLDTMAGTDSVDLINTLAMPLATQVIFELLGVKVVDRERFLQLNNQVTSGSILGAELAPLVAEYIGFIHELIEEKRNQPGDDLLSAMIAVGTRVTGSATTS